MASYSPLSRLLHRIALDSRAVAATAFDIEQSIYRPDPAAIIDRRHVFVSGLARAGTTVLMRRFFATGVYRSLTYRDMPFVLMPNLWRRLSISSRKQGATAERAHGDGILVDFDSPEALEEVFWRVFCGDRYLFETYLAPMTADSEEIDCFRRYVADLLTSGGDGCSRYLSKNNNNILRLQTIRTAFPNALIVIPFRDPVQHAASLLRQHRQFIATQSEDPFIRKYMGWLCHHEFGSDHRPFRFDSKAIPHEPDSIDYWLALWNDTYGFLLETAPPDAVFLSYESMCGETGAVWGRLQALAELPAQTEPESEPLELRWRSIDTVCDAVALGNGRDLYQRLLDRSNEALA